MYKYKWPPLLFEQLFYQPLKRGWHIGQLKWHSSVLIKSLMAYKGSFRLTFYLSLSPDDIPSVNLKLKILWLYKCPLYQSAHLFEGWDIYLGLYLYLMPCNQQIFLGHLLSCVLVPVLMYMDCLTLLFILISVTLLVPSPVLLLIDKGFSLSMSIVSILVVHLLCQLNVPQYQFSLGPHQ